MAISGEHVGGWWLVEEDVVVVAVAAAVVTVVVRSLWRRSWWRWLWIGVCAWGGMESE